MLVSAAKFKLLRGPHVPLRGTMSTDLKNLLKA